MGKQLDFLQQAQRLAADGEKGCIVWPWAAVVRSDGSGGYGMVRWGGRTRGAHLVSLLLWSGVDRGPEGLQAAHYVCGNRKCVNPVHLRWSTPKENSEDMVRHGTSPAGERHGRAKLTDVDVMEIRRRRAEGQTTTHIGAKFGLSPGYVSRVARGVRWSHLDQPATAPPEKVDQPAGSSPVSASQLIEELQALISEFGDVPVVMRGEGDSMLAVVGVNHWQRRASRSRPARRAFVLKL